MVITLSQDSQNLSITSSQGSQCGVGAVRLVKQTTTTAHSHAARLYNSIMLPAWFSFSIIVIDL